MFETLKNFYDRHHKIISIIVLLIIFLLCSHMFNDMIDRKMTSDFADHVDEAMNMESYSLMGFMMYGVYALTGSVYSIGYLCAFLTAITAYVSALYIKKILEMMDVTVDESRLLLITAASLFICKLCIPDWSQFYYRDSISTQPWHSSTFILMRMLAMPTVYYYFKIQKNYLEKVEVKDLLIFAALCFLVDFAKPSYMIGFAPVMLMVLIKDFLISRGKSFRNAFLFGCCVLFGCSIMIFQTGNLFPEGEDYGVTVSLANALKMFAENRKYFFNMPFDFAFPIFAAFLVFDSRKIFSRYDMTMYRQSWIMLAVSMLEYLFIRETGIRETHLNFRWGQQYFSYLIFIMSIVMIIKIIRNKGNGRPEITAAKSIYVAHVIFGVAYFMLICLLHYFYLEI